MNVYLSAVVHFEGEGVCNLLQRPLRKQLTVFTTSKDSACLPCKKFWTCILEDEMSLYLAIYPFDKST